MTLLQDGTSTISFLTNTRYSARDNIYLKIHRLSGKKHGCISETPPNQIHKLNKKNSTNLKKQFAKNAKISIFVFGIDPNINSIIKLLKAERIKNVRKNIISYFLKWLLQKNCCKTKKRSHKNVSRNRSRCQKMVRELCSRKLNQPNQWQKNSENERSNIYLRTIWLN